MTAKKSMQTKEETTMVISDDRPKWAGTTSLGSENVTVDDVTVPRLSIIQDLSPQRKKSDEAYIPGAEEGMMFNTVTNELYDGSVLVVPVYFRKEYVAWKNRDAGGGFRGTYSSQAEARQAISALEDSSSIEIVDTAQQFCLISTDGVKWTEAVLSMAKSNAGVSRKWNSAIMLRESDRFAQVYDVSPALENGAKGDYYKFKVEWKGWAPKEVAERGLESYKAINANLKSADYSDVDSTTAQENDF